MTRSRKGQRGQETRAKVLAAATRLFYEQGYLVTTMADIAGQAGVAVQTLYLGFGSKVELLAAVHDIALVADDEPISVLERPWRAELQAEPDGPNALRLLMAQQRDMLERTSRVYGVIAAAAADPEVLDLQGRLRDQRAVTWRSVAADLAAKRGYDATVSVDRAADLLYAVTSPELFGLLTTDRGWTANDATAWMTTILTGQLFGGAGR